MGFSNLLGKGLFSFFRKGIFLKSLIYLILLHCCFSIHANAQTTASGVVKLANGATRAIPTPVRVEVLAYRSNFTIIDSSSHILEIPAGQNQANFNVNNIDQSGEFYEIQYYCNGECGQYEFYYFHPTGPRYFSPFLFDSTNTDDALFLLSELNGITNDGPLELTMTPFREFGGTISFDPGNVTGDDLEYRLNLSFKLPGSNGNQSLPTNIRDKIEVGENSNLTPYRFTYPPVDDFEYEISLVCEFGCPDGYVDYIGLHPNGEDYIYNFRIDHIILASDIPDVVDFVIIQRDTDNDNIDIENDNCPLLANPDQFDSDFDGMGDVCDPDDDNDNILDGQDNCPFDFNQDQINSDNDIYGDACDDDDDNDTVSDFLDNCPITANTNQSDIDEDAQGDACDSDADGDGVESGNDSDDLNRFKCSDTDDDGCDECSTGSFTSVADDGTDTDGDGMCNIGDSDDDNDTVPDAEDNCPVDANTDQLDNDDNGIGDVCDTFIDGDNDSVQDHLDNCPLIPNQDQANNDGDEQGDVCDDDDDNDNIIDALDNCPINANEDQLNTDDDAQGDACDADDDNDNVLDELDNCPINANENQLNTDEDTHGNACDDDDDNDNIVDTQDNCPIDANEGQLNTDEDAQGDTCDTDDDNDNVLDELDNCPINANENQLNTDDDAQGNACDDDDDNDNVLDALDNCPINANENQLNTDNDIFGNACDEDDDNDTVIDNLDNCPIAANTDQSDIDGDGQGDVCDPDADGDGVEASNDSDDLNKFMCSDLDDDGCDECSSGSFTSVAEDGTDTDGDGMCNIGDTDDDNDTILDIEDNCPVDVNTDQADQNDDGIGDVCEEDDFCFPIKTKNGTVAMICI